MTQKPEGVFALDGWQSRAASALTSLVQTVRIPNAGRRSPAKASPNRHQLATFEHRVYSMKGEDGILHEIFFRIGQGRRYFVEFGVQDGSECNTALLAERYGWYGLYIEASAADAAVLRARWAHREDILVRQEFLNAENVAGVFSECAVPQDLDLLSIDVDGNDYWIWKALSAYKPRVVIMEYNAAYPPPVRWIMAYDRDHLWDGTTHFGASLSALCDLAGELGYSFIGTESHGINAFFLRSDVLEQSGFLAVTPEQGYHRPRYGRLGLPHHFRPGPFVTRG